MTEETGQRIANALEELLSIEREKREKVKAAMELEKLTTQMRWDHAKRRREKAALREQK